MPLVSDSLTLWLPDELSVLIFNLVLDKNDFSSYSEYARARLRLCVLSTGWKRLIFRTPLFWNKIRVSLFHPDAATKHIQRTGDDTPLHMRLEIKNVEMYQQQQGEDHDLHADLDDTLEEVVSTIDRWRSLYVVTDDGTCLEHIRMRLLPFAPALLRSFTLVFRRLLLLDGTIRYEPQNIPSPTTSTNWFQSLPLRFSLLSLRCVGFDLQTQGLTGLCRLEMEMVPPSFYPSFEDYAHIIGSCTRLSYLRLRWIGCHGLRSHMTETLYSSSIHHLDIGFNSYNSLGDLVALFRFPNLHTVHMKTTSVHGLAAATRAAPFLVNFNYLQLENDNASVDFIAALKSRLPLLDIPDLSLSARLLDQGTYFNPLPSGSFCPSDSFHRREAAEDLTLSIQLPPASSIARADDDLIDTLCSSFMSFTLVPGHLDVFPSLKSIWAVRLS
ncbi:hypothetical protein C8J57DRAFT_293041 [Mycena rebaudengoi]|nr:hypothetical protein C8J57DRAFT_293041 [Mycena rebaudengoi]